MLEEKQSEKNLVVTINSGKIAGECRNGLAIFRGIPYGGACEGERRFLPPRPAQEWKGIKDCTKNGKYAIQPGKDIVSTDDLGGYFSGGHPELFGVDQQEQDENCLVLNVMTPGVDDKKRPVVVYIHGGGFATGSGTLVLGADRWVQEEDIVVVGVNHRLNVFGYLYLGEYDKAYEDSGMAGMLDLILALEWVKQNISVFGGNPNLVTIMGESGGGMKVSTLMAMPSAKGLFQRAIVESGSAPVGKISREEAVALTKELLERLDIKEDEWQKLLTVPAKDLISAVNSLPFCPYTANENLCGFEEVREIPLLVGASEDELAVFLPVAELEITEKNLKNQLLQFSKQQLFGVADIIDEENVDNIIKVFQEYHENKITSKHLFLHIISQASFLGGGSFYQALEKVKQGGADGFSYLVKFDTPLPMAPDYKASWHTADLPLQMRIVLYPECEELSRKLGHCFAAFIRTGNPSTPEIVWPAFSEEKKETMMIDNEWSVKLDPLKQIHACMRVKW